MFADIANQDAAKKAQIAQQAQEQMAFDAFVLQGMQHLAHLIAAEATCHSRNDVVVLAEREHNDLSIYNTTRSGRIVLHTHNSVCSTNPTLVSKITIDITVDIKEGPHRVTLNHAGVRYLCADGGVARSKTITSHVNGEPVIGMRDIALAIGSSIGALLPLM